MYNVIEEPLGRENVLLPPLHIKLGLVKQFVIALDFGGEGFQEIRFVVSQSIRGQNKWRSICWS